MNDFRDRAIENALEEKVGAKPAPDLSARILEAAREKGLLESAASAPQPARRTRRVTGRRFAPQQRRANYALAIYGTAIVLSVFVAIALVYLFGLPERATTQANTPVTGTKPDVTPQPEPHKPALGNSEEPQSPTEKPAPKEGPKNPDEMPPVERPVKPPTPPEPEKPVETPRKPDEVEKPVEPSKEPEKTEPKRAEKRAVATILGAPKQAKLRVRYIESEPWRELGDEALFEGAMLQCVEPVDVQLSSTILLRLDGEAQLGMNVELVKGKLYVDNLGADAAMGINHKEVRLNLLGVAVFDLDGDNIEIACLEGGVACAKTEMEGRYTATARPRGLGSIKPLTPSRTRDAFLKGMPIRSLCRADFAEKPTGLLREGEIADGVAFGPRIFWSFGRNERVLAGSVMRLRIRVTGADKINFSLFAPDRDDNFGNDGVAVKPGEWVELEIELSAFKDRGTHKQSMAVGEEFMNVQIWTEKDGAKIELDWIEFARRPAK